MPKETKPAKQKEAVAEQADLHKSAVLAAAAAENEAMVQAARERNKPPAETS